MTKLTEVFLLIFSNLAGTTSTKFQIGPTGQILSSVGTNDILDVVKNGGVGYADLNVGNLLINNKPVFNSEGAAIKAENGVSAEQAHAWNSKANPSSRVFKTLFANAWAGSEAPFVQTVDVMGLTSTSTGVIGIPLTASKEQHDVAADAQLRLTAQSNGRVSISAYGVKPEIDIPVQITIVG